MAATVLNLEVVVGALRWPECIMPPSEVRGRTGKGLDDLTAGLLVLVIRAVPGNDETAVICF